MRIDFLDFAITMVSVTMATIESISRTTVTVAMDTAQPEESYEQPLAVTVIFLIIGVVGFTGNVLVCVVIASTLAWSRGGTTNLLILNQALVDSITSLILILQYALPYPEIPASGGWAEFVCRMWVQNTLLWMLFVVSTYNLCAMSLERYCAVAYPLVYSTRFNKRTAALMILFSWVVAPLLHYYYPIAYDYHDGSTCSNRGQSTTVSVIGVLIFVWEFFIPFTIMAVLYTRIVYLLRLQQRRVRVARVNPGADATTSPAATGPSRIHFEQGHDGEEIVSATVATHDASADVSPGGRSHLEVPRGPNAAGQRRQRAPSETVRRNVTITLLAVFVMYGICWMPNHITFLQFGLGGPLDLRGGWYYFTLILSYLNMSINPFIYALKYKIFKKGFRRLFCRGTGCSRCYDREVHGGRDHIHERLPPRSVNTVSGSDRS